MSNKKCIFDDTIDCERFTHGEYVCAIFGQKCDNFKYRISRVEIESGNMISLIFKEAI